MVLSIFKGHKDLDCAAVHSIEERVGRLKGYIQESNLTVQIIQYLFLSHVGFCHSGYSTSAELLILLHNC